MDTLPRRLIAHVFAEKFPPARSRARLREQLTEVCKREGSCLLDLVFDHERAERQPSDYSSLLRIAAGEADGLLLVRLPLSLEVYPTMDLLCSALTPPLCMLDKATLVHRGLLPRSPARRRAALAGSKRKKAGKPREQTSELSRVGAGLRPSV
jgi:hypothetical protein